MNDARIQGYRAATPAALHAIPMFQHLGDDELHALARVTQKREYRREDVVADPGDEEERLFAIAQGEAHLYSLSPFGREVVLSTLHPGDVYGLAIFEPSANIKCRLRAATNDTIIYCPPRREVERLMHACPAVAVCALAQVSERLRDAYDLIAELVFEDVEVRLTHLLARRALADPQYTVRTSHQELGTLVGATREEVTKALNHLRDRDLIEYGPERRRIVVPDPEALLSSVVTTRRRRE